MTEKLVERGYKGRVVDTAINRVRELKMEDILQRVVREDENKNRVRGVFRFDRRLPNLSAIMR